MRPSSNSHHPALPSAVAIVYGAGDAAPRVAAKGRGLIAQAIIDKAREHGVYVHESKELVGLLMQVDLDQRIPPQLYRAVAELLVWVYRLEQAQPGSSATPESGLQRAPSEAGLRRALPL